MVSHQLSRVLIGLIGLCIVAFWVLGPWALIVLRREEMFDHMWLALGVLWLALSGAILRLTLATPRARQGPTAWGTRLWGLGWRSVVSVLAASGLLLGCLVLGALGTQRAYAVREVQSVVMFALLGGLCLGLLRWAWRREAQSVAHQRVARALLGLIGGAVCGIGLSLPVVVVSRSGSQVAPLVGTGEHIRTAFARYAAESVGNAFPSPVHLYDYATLRRLVNQHGAALPAREAQAGFRFLRYARQDTDHDGTPDAYVLILVPLHAGVLRQIKQLRLTPRGVERVGQEEPRRGCGSAPHDVTGPM